MPRPSRRSGWRETRCTPRIDPLPSHDSLESRSLGVRAKAESSRAAGAGLQESCDAPGRALSSVQAELGLPDLPIVAILPRTDGGDRVLGEYETSIAFLAEHYPPPLELELSAVENPVVSDGLEDHLRSTA